MIPRAADASGSSAGERRSVARRAAFLPMCLPQSPPMLASNGRHTVPRPSRVALVGVAHALASELRWRRRSSSVRHAVSGASRAARAGRAHAIARVSERAQASEFAGNAPWRRERVRGPSPETACRTPRGTRMPTRGRCALVVWSLRKGTFGRLRRGRASLCNRCAVSRHSPARWGVRGVRLAKSAYNSSEAKRAERHGVRPGLPASGTRQAPHSRRSFTSSKEAT
jgi:hypothetical protein